MVNRYSGYAWTAKLSNTSTRQVLSHLESWFTEFGWPLVIRSDNGPQFRSELGFFCQAHGITHELSSPYNPESNGLAEAAVKNMKSLVLRCKSKGENFAHALAAWQNMVRQDGTSPAQLFFGRRQRLGVPRLPELLLQSQINPSTRDSLHKERIADRDLHTVSLPDFNVGDRVWMQHHATQKWYKTANIIEIRHGGRAYLVKDDSGQQSVRGRRFLRLDDRKLHLMLHHLLFLNRVSVLEVAGLPIS